MSIILATALAAALVGYNLVAQVEGNRGIAPIAASNDIEVGGITVDVSADNAQEAQRLGWQEAQRKAWEKLGGPGLPDSRLDAIVSAIVIEKEQVAPKRYIATLGVIFDRGRAGALLGQLTGRKRSAPILLLPVTITGGTAIMYETVNPWQRAWAEYATGASQIHYVRPSGAGGDSLLLTYGQVGRRSRTWWRNVLDQFGATDVIVPIANLSYRWPGGPVDGVFTARYGADNTYLTSFKMTAKDRDQVPQMLTNAVQRFDQIYTKALQDGQLRPDSTLNMASGARDPAIERLLEIGRQIEARERAKSAPEPSSPPTETVVRPADIGIEEPREQESATRSYVVQFATPDGGAIDATLAAVRSASGVQGASTSSIAIGGTSVMSVSYKGSLSELAAALRARGFAVSQGAGGLSISR